MMGPKNKDELRAMLTSRQFPNEWPAQTQAALQTPSDRMRERALVFGETLFGLVPDSEYHQLVGNVLMDLVVMGEERLCRMHDVKTEHEPTRVLTQRQVDQTFEVPGPSPKAKRAR